MICLRCGYCCHNYMVVIVKDPEKGICEDNLIVHMEEGNPCPHLRGNKPGEYWCAIHNQSWYKDIPCYSHGQIEKTNSPCRVGKYVLSNL